MRFVELQTRPLTEAAPAPGTITTEKDTLIAHQVSATEADLYVTDDKGKALKVRAGSTQSGGGGGTTPPIKDVLTAGNALDGKHFEGVLKSIDADVPNNVSSTFSSDKDSFSYNRTTNDENTSLEVSSRGVSFNSSNSSTNENTHFEATQSLRYSKNNFNSNVNLEASDFSLKFGIFDRSMPGNDMEFIVEKERATYSIPYRDPMNPMAPATPLRYEINKEGIKADKYLKPTQDEQFVQKKYVDGLLGGGKPEVTIDRMYLNYAGKLAVDITVTGMGGKASDSAAFQHSSIQTFISNGKGSANVAQGFGFSSGSGAVIQITDSDTETGVCKAHIEIESTMLPAWGNAKGDVLSNTYIEFTYVPEAMSGPSTWAKSRRTYYGEKYTEGQAGVVDYQLKSGKQSLLITSTEEYKMFALDNTMFDVENPTKSLFHNKFGNGAPLGSHDIYSGNILADNRIMPNPTPGQVTDWELTLRLSGNNIDALNTDGYRAVIYDAENNPLDEVPVFSFTGGASPAPAHDVKVTLRTVNYFKNIVGNKRGFKLGIRSHNANSGLDINFELKHIRRISHSVA